MPTSLLGRTHFHLERHAGFIQAHGQSVLIFPVLQCPCLNSDRQFDPLCSACQGSGRYYPPQTSYVTTMLLVHEHSRREFYEAGTWMPGTIQATLLPGIRLCERDKVRLLNVRDIYTDEVLTRGIDDRVRFSAGVQLLLVADRDRVYEDGRDYVLSVPGTVTWVSGGQMPAFGAQYSVKYEAQPEFLVVPDTPRLRHEHLRAQTQVVMLSRLDHLSEEV